MKTKISIVLLLTAPLFAAGLAPTTQPSPAPISTEAATVIRAKLSKVLNQPLDVLRKEGRRMVVEAWASFEYDPKLETLKVKEQFHADRRMQLVAAADQAKTQYDALRERLNKEMTTLRAQMGEGASTDREQAAGIDRYMPRLAAIKNDERAYRNAAAQVDRKLTELRRERQSLESERDLVVASGQLPTRHARGLPDLVVDIDELSAESAPATTQPARSLDEALKAIKALDSERP